MLCSVLQTSLSGQGAKVSIICNITPSSSQAEETRNTLQFANRAKQIRIAVSKNETMDAELLIKRYQREIAELRAQVAVLSSGQGAAVSDTLHAMQASLVHNAAAEVEQLQWQLHTQQLITEDAMAERSTLEHLNHQLVDLLVKDSMAGAEGLCEGVDGGATAPAAAGQGLLRRAWSFEVQLLCSARVIVRHTCRPYAVVLGNFCCFCCFSFQS